MSAACLSCAPTPTATSSRAERHAAADHRHRRRRHPDTADDIVVEGNLAAPISTAAARWTGHAFLADVAHEAVPVGKIADGDITIGLGDPATATPSTTTSCRRPHSSPATVRVNESIGPSPASITSSMPSTTGLSRAQPRICPRHQRPRLHQQSLATDIGATARRRRRSTLSCATAAPVPGGRVPHRDAVLSTSCSNSPARFDQHHVFLVPDGFDTTIDPSIVASRARGLPASVIPC